MPPSQGLPPFYTQKKTETQGSEDLYTQDFPAPELCPSTPGRGVEEGWKVRGEGREGRAGPVHDGGPLENITGSQIYLEVQSERECVSRFLTWVPRTVRCLSLIPHGFLLSDSQDPLTPTSGC